jgi:membrane protein DedA with SNARE-associated domain
MNQEKDEYNFLAESCEILSTAEIKKSRKRIKVLTILLTSISIFLIIYTLTNLEQLQTEFSTQVQNYGIPGLFAMVFLLELIPQLVSPIIILIAGIFAGINVHLAILTAVFASAMGSTLGFTLGKKYVCKALNILGDKKAIAKITKLTNKYGKIMIPIAAFSPLPYLPVLFGAMNFTKKNFLIYGLIPRTLSLIAYGYIARII